MAKDSNRGLANASEQTRKRVASEGGSAYHEKRGKRGTDHKMPEEGGQQGGNQ